MFCAIKRATPYTYLAAEIRPGDPVRLADGYPQPAEGIHAFVADLETDDREVVSLPVYVPAAVLVDYEAFVVFVLEQTGEMFCCDAVEREHRSAGQMSAWRRHVTSALTGRAGTRCPARPDDDRREEARDG